MQLVAEIIVLDSDSTDGTQEIAEQYGVKVIPTEWQGYAKTKNYGNSLCTHDWILSIDADEVLSSELIESIYQLTLEENTVYTLDRIANFCGKWIRHSGWYPDWKPRLFNRKHVFWEGDFVHETLQIPSEFRVQRLYGKLYHYSYKDLDDHLERTKKYARLAAEAMQAEGKKIHPLKRLLGPAVRFIRTFIIKRGFLDGKAGVDY